MSERLWGLYIEDKETRNKESEILERMDYNIDHKINEACNLEQVFYSRQYALNQKYLFIGKTDKNYWVLVDNFYTPIYYQYYYKDVNRIEENHEHLQTVFPDTKLIKLQHYDTISMSGVTFLNAEVRRMIVNCEGELIGYGKPIKEEEEAKELLRNRHSYRDRYFFEKGFKSAKESFNRDYLEARKEIEEKISIDYVYELVELLSIEIFGNRYMASLDLSTVEMSIYKLAQ